MTARAAVFEIVERRTRPDSGSAAESIVVPNMVRVNGAEILIPRDEPITIHDLANDDVVKVTLTVFARRIFVGGEHVDADAIDAVAAATKALDDAYRAQADALTQANAAIETARTQLVSAHQQIAALTAEGAE